MTVTSDEAIGDDRDRDRDRADGESFSELAERSIKSNIIRETKCGIKPSRDIDLNRVNLNGSRPY